MKKVKVYQAKKKGHQATMDDVALGSLHHFPGVGMRGVREDRSPGNPNNSYTARQRSSRIGRMFKNGGKREQAWGNAASYAQGNDAFKARQEVRAKRGLVNGQELDITELSPEAKAEEIRRIEMEIELLLV